MNPRQTLFAIAALLILGAIALGLVPRSVATDIGGGDVECGSVFEPISKAGSIEDNITGSDIGESCEGKRSDMKLLMFGGLGLGIVALIVSFAASNSRPESSASGGGKPSWWR